jgi:hypothetical protein
VATTVQPDASAAQFEHALAQAPSNSAAASPAAVGSAGSPGNLAIDSKALAAADDAWVRFLAVSERLQNPLLPAAAKDSLMKDLTANWRSFRSEPVVRQLDDYLASQDAGLRGEPRT